MQRRMLGLALLGAALGKAAASAVAGVAAAETAPDIVFAQDDACDAGDADCSLELRQLRASGKTPVLDAGAAEAEPAVDKASSPDGDFPVENEKSEDGDDDVDDVDAAKEESDHLDIQEAEGSLPGGWGEAAEMVREDEQANGSTLSAAWGWDTCARQGCHHHFIHGRSCQCNPGCIRYMNCCWDYGVKCTTWHQRRRRSHHSAPAKKSGARYKTLYHNTSPQAGRRILKNGFQPGRVGWCGGGIYFAESPAATKTKAIGPDSHQGFLIEAVVDVGNNVAHMDRHCGRHMSASKASAGHFSSVSFNPGDGTEWVVYNPRQVVSTKRYYR